MSNFVYDGSKYSGSEGAKAFGYAMAVTFAVLVILYLSSLWRNITTRRRASARNHWWSLRGSNSRDPTELTQNGHTEPTGDNPRMSDIWIDSWNPLPSQPQSQFMRQGPDQRQGEVEGRNAPRAVNDQNKSGWEGFLPLSVEKASDPDTTISSQVNIGYSGNPVRPTSSAQIQISTIILMPSPKSLSSAHSLNPLPNNACVPPREYALGTYSILYTPQDQPPLG